MPVPAGQDYQSDPRFDEVCRLLADRGFGGPAGQLGRPAACLYGRDLFAQHPEWSAEEIAAEIAARAAAG